MRITIRPASGRPRPKHYECIDCYERWHHYYKIECPHCGSDKVYWVN